MDGITAMGSVWTLLFAGVCLVSPDLTTSLPITAASMLKGEFRGVDLENRRLRLRRLGSERSSMHHSSTPTVPSTASTSLSNTGTENVNDGNNDGNLNIDQLNEKAGVAEYLYGGDIDLTEDQLDAMEASRLSKNSSRRKRQVHKYNPKWTNNHVYYYFDPNTDAKVPNVVRKALKYISARTCIDFTENATARNRVRVFSGSGCYSKLGMLGNEQDLSLMGSCASVGLAAHEFMHALGVLHMHSREDRDNFLKVDLSSVDPAGCGEYLYAAAKWQTKTYSFGDTISNELREDETTCNHWIKAPKGRKVQINVTAMRNVPCGLGCKPSSIEPKVFANAAITNPRMCCPSHMNKVLTSALNPMPVISYNAKGTSTFTIKYRFL